MGLSFDFDFDFELFLFALMVFDSYFNLFEFVSDVGVFIGDI